MGTTDFSFVTKDLSDVELDETEPITIGKSGKASYCGDKSLDFSYSDEIKAYIATGFDKDEEIIWLTRVKRCSCWYASTDQGRGQQDL